MQITTEITSSAIASDGPIHTRLLYAYEAAKNFTKGSLLEVGCGEGRGIDMISESVASYTAIDKNKPLLNHLSEKYPSYTFIHGNVPPFEAIESNSFDSVIAFQVIEHIKNDSLFLQEIHRVLKPGGVMVISTPNIEKTLTRNPWHEREYTAQELENIVKKSFANVQCYGVTGTQKVWDYYQENKKSVDKITRWDVFNLQYRLPSAWLRIPYDILNRWNRNKLMSENQGLVTGIQLSDFYLCDNPSEGFDLFLVAHK